MFSFGKKRTKSDISEDSTPERTPAKKVNIEGSQGNTVNIPGLQCLSYDPEMTTTTPVSSSDLDLQNIQFDKSAPLYAQQTWDQLKVLTVHMTSLAASYKMLETKLIQSQDSAKTACEKVDSLEVKIKELESENKLLKDAQTQAEAYSKKNNLIFYNVTENPRETSQSLRDHVGQILYSVGIDIRPMYIDNIHRLPAYTKGGIRPIIIKFVSYLDRDCIWSQRDKLGGHPSKMSIREHYPKEMEKNIRQLLPIRRAAKEQGVPVRMTGDKLMIRGKAYTVKNLHALPESLRPENVTTRKIDNYLFFFNEACPFSNFHKSKFSIDGQSYSCAEQWIQEQKATHFRDASTAKLIMDADTPGKMKALGKKCSNFSDKAWRDASPEILHKGLLEKFLQNPHLQVYLLSTGSTDLVEAAENDKWFGIGWYLWDKISSVTKRPGVTTFREKH